MSVSCLHVVALLAALVPVANTCFASGVCGGMGLGGLGGPCMSPIPPVPPPCGGGVGCGAGYSCGAYGCYRTRARVHGAGTVRSGPMLMGADRFSQFRKVEIPLSRDPNAMFMSCCEQRGLPDSCLRHCTYNTYTKDSITRMYFKHDACPVEATAEIQFCAAQGRDHRACCQRNGVSTTLAGMKCLTFCDQRPGNVTLLDMSYLPCYDRFENMKACFWHDSAHRYK